MTDTTDLAEVPDYIVSVFYAWLWFVGETRGSLPLGESEDVAQLWVDDRLVFRAQGAMRPSTTLTGENPSSAPEARAALLGGKMVQDVRLALRRDDREYTVTLRGPRMEIQQAKLPGMLKGGDDAEMLYERMFLYEELQWLVSRLFLTFAEAWAADRAGLVDTLRQHFAAPAEPRIEFQDGEPA